MNEAKMEVDEVITSSQETASLSGEDLFPGDDLDGKQSNHHDDISQNVQCIDEKILARLLIPTNCQEKIIFVLDSSVNIDTMLPLTDCKKSYLDLLKNSLSMFFLTKSTFNSKHQFAVTLLPKNSTFMFQAFSNDSKKLIDCLNDIEVSNENDADHILCLDVVLEEIMHNFDISFDSLTSVTIPKHVTRVIFVLNCSDRIVKTTQSTDIGILQQVLTSPSFFMDFLLLDIQTSGNKQTNNLQENLDLLTNLSETNYVLQASHSAAEIFEGFAKLLPHPLQRSQQSESSYEIVA